MTLERRLKRAKYFIAKRDAELAKRGTTAGQETAKRAAAIHPALSASIKWAAQNPDNAAYDNDGNPVEREPRGYTKDGGH